MPIDPLELQLLRDRIVRLHGLQQHALARAAHPPRIGPEAWRGPAYRAYSLAADELQSRLRAVAEELTRTLQLARTELARVGV
ncbi:hypothetical protein [Protaetiibacter intestinalis]|uniref:Uncharacterized protein n=1 Tax=Protaetiibacter intestinalis TaxID=2419774 RepID=A0A387B9F0_9MICO|nr:hypothetical protein [Protaetiibacter intestinalis]AYF97795.1 hypothetical protein D7I47_05675 [Protaetiibacter intestinalis]